MWPNYSYLSLEYKNKLSQILISTNILCRLVLCDVVCVQHGHKKNAYDTTDFNYDHELTKSYVNAHKVNVSTRHVNEQPKMRSSH